MESKVIVHGLPISRLEIGGQDGTVVLIELGFR